MTRPEADWFANLAGKGMLAEFSLWSADLLNLDKEIGRVSAVADLLHLDVADGIFAPSYLFFPDLVAAIRRKTMLPLHVHLMVEGPALASQIEQFCAAGADVITFHIEATSEPARLLDLIASRDVYAGLAVRPDTPVSQLAVHLDGLAMVTVLGTELGVKGKGLDARAPGRIAEARRMIDRAHRSGRTFLLADGGIRQDTLSALREAGADGVVLGSLGFGAVDLNQLRSWLASLSAGTA